MVTSYRCENATIDSTGKSPADPPDIALEAGQQMDFRLGAEEVPDKLELRLYPRAGMAASFLRWPEELPTGIAPLEQYQPGPASNFQIIPQAPPGGYSLVVRATWDEDVDVFYTLSLGLE